MTILSGVIKNNMVRPMEPGPAGMGAGMGGAGAVAAPAAPRARIIDLRDNVAVVEITCECGRRTVLNCEYGRETK